MNHCYSRVFAVVLISLLSLTTAATPASIAATGNPTTVQRWLAMGDSYSAGEGTSGAGNSAWSGAYTREANDGACQRSDHAWAPLALHAINSDKSSPVHVGNFKFVACTGAVAYGEPRDADGQPNNAAAQIREAISQMNFPPPYDLISFSFGGNDLDFAGIVRDCLGILGDFTTKKPPKCNKGEQYLQTQLGTARGNINRLLSDVLDSDALDKFGTGRHGPLLAPGGHLMVFGYPLGLSDPIRWVLKSAVKGDPIWRYPLLCNGIAITDADRLRRLGTELNRTINDAVSAANSAHGTAGHPGYRVATFVDVVPSFEPHDLCVDGAEWLNGYGALIDLTGTSRYPQGKYDRDGWSCPIAIGPLTASCRYQRSFHPNDDGHKAEAALAASTIRSLDWSLLGIPGLPTSGPSPTPSQPSPSSTPTLPADAIAALVGKWRDLRDNSITTFYPDATFTAAGSPISCSGNVVVLGPASYRFEAQCFGTQYAHAQLKDSQTLLVDNGRRQDTFKKIN